MNIAGIILEIIGFFIILFAVRAVKPKGGSFSGIWDKNQNLMSTLHPWLNRAEGYVWLLQDYYYN